MKAINWTYVIVAVMLGISIMAYGGLTFYSKERDRQVEATKLEEQKEAAKFMDQEGQIRRSNLQLCLDSAQAEYLSTFKVNSDPAPTKDNPSVRRWIAASIEASTTQKLNDDKEFCLKQYGN